MLNVSSYGLKNVTYKIRYLSVYLGEQIIALTKMGHIKRDFKQLLSCFSKN